MAYWSELPHDLTVLVANQLLDIEDFLSFSSVCHNWRLVYLNRDWKPRHTIPWAVLGEYYDDDYKHNVRKRKFVSLSRLKLHTLSLPEARGCRCWGTSHHWIVTFDQAFKICIVDPISRESINLPPNPALRNTSPTETDWYAAIQKATVVTLRDEFVTVIIYAYNSALAFSKLGDNDWTPVLFPFPVRLSHVVCFRDQILAITMVGALMLLDIDGDHGPRGHFVAAPPENEKGWGNAYLVGSSDNLLLVLSYRPRFRVYRLDISRMKWIALDDLGDDILFVDDYDCISVSASSGYLKPNSIYVVDVTHKPYNRRFSISVYNIKNGTTEVSWIGGAGSHFYNCPVWIIPRLG